MSSNSSPKKFPKAAFVSHAGLTENGLILSLQGWPLTLVFGLLLFVLFFALLWTIDKIMSLALCLQVSLKLNKSVRTAALNLQSGCTV